MHPCEKKHTHLLPAPPRWWTASTNRSWSSVVHRRRGFGSVERITPPTSKSFVPCKCENVKDLRASEYVPYESIWVISETNRLKTKHQCLDDKTVSFSNTCIDSIPSWALQHSNYSILKRQIKSITLILFKSEPSDFLYFFYSLIQSLELLPIFVPVLQVLYKSASISSKSSQSTLGKEQSIGIKMGTCPSIDTYQADTY